MSEEKWNGITLATIGLAYFHSILNWWHPITRLVDSDAGVDYTFTTPTEGAVIVSDHYLMWEFITPDNYVVSPGVTVADMFNNLASAVTAHPIQAWDDFSDFLNGKQSTINEHLQEGASTIITDAQGNTYPGTIHRLPTFSGFVDVINWMKTWMGSEVLAAPSSVMMQSDSVASIALTARDVTIHCSFQF